MEIRIDFNGSIAKCAITEYFSPNVWVNFNTADEFSQIFALDSFRVIKEHWERSHKTKPQNQYVKCEHWEKGKVINKRIVNLK